jgi:quercetin dioxygenase-like cupin family protein
VGTPHDHPHEQLVYVTCSLKVTVNGTSFMVPAGGSFIVTSNARHCAAALEDSIVLDVFTPSREDYV